MISDILNLMSEKLKTHTTNILNWAEKHMKTDVRYLAKGSFWLLSSQAVNFILTFILLWVFANLLPKEIYGQYRFFITIVSLLGLAALPGMTTAMVQAVAQGKLGVYKPIVNTRIRWGFWGSFGGLIGAIYYYLQEDITMSLLFLLVAIFVPFINSYVSYDAYLNGIKDFRLMAILHTIQRIFVVLILVIAITLTKNIFIILTTYLLSMTLSFKLAEYYTLKTHPPNNTTDPSAITYGKHLSLMSLMRAGANYADKIALWYLAGPLQLAQYVIAVAIPQELTAALGQISRLALPKMSNRHKSELRQSLLRKVAIYFFAIIPIIVLYIISAPLIFSLFLPQYIDSVFFSQLASLLIISAPVLLLTQYFYAIKHTKALYIMNTAEPLALIILYLILIPLYGVIGVIIASLIRFILLFIALIILFLNSHAE